MRGLRIIERGVLTGAGLVGAIYLPAFALGYARELTGLNTYFLLPAFVLLLLPGGLIGYWAAMWLDERTHAWRFNAGLFLGGSTAAGLLILGFTEEPDLWQRFSAATFGGLFLGGIWLWLGALLGTSQGAAKKEKMAPPLPRVP